MGETLSDKVRGFSKIKLRKAVVKVPKLKVRREIAVKSKKGSKVPISSIINILIKSAIEDVKGEKKEKLFLGEEKGYKILKEDKNLINGGYGAVSNSYAGLVQRSYVDYAKLFSYLGKFKSKNFYESLTNGSAINSTLDSGTFSLIDKETMERGARHARYFTPLNELNTLSAVPIAGMSSSEWEQFRLWMKLDPIMYRLKTSTS